MNEVSLENAKKTFFLALGIDMTVTVVSMVSDFWVIDVLKTVAASGFPASKSAIDNIELWRKFGFLMLLTTCWVGWTLTRWIGTCYAYAKEGVRATGFRHEKWITWGWIVPFLNLFKPYQVLSEIYRAGASGYAQSDDWKKEPGSGWLLTWWIFWSITHLAMMAALKATTRKPAPDSPTLNQIIGSYNDAILFCAVSLLIAGLWFLVAGNLTKRLVERSDRPFKQVATANKVAHVAPASNDAYAEALAEIEEGRLDKGTWARSFAESGGDESKAKALYIKARVAAIGNEAVWVNTQPPTKDIERTEPVKTSRTFQSDDSLPKWVPAFIAFVLIAGVVGYQQLNNGQKVAASQAQAQPQEAAQSDHGPWEKFQSQAPGPYGANDKIIAGPYGKNDKLVAGPYDDKKRDWSENPFDKFDSVNEILARARQFPQLNEPRAWAAVLAWQESNMRVDKNPANEALYYAVGTVLDGLRDNKGVCRPGQVEIVSAAQASKSFPAGTLLTLLECDR